MGTSHHIELAERWAQKARSREGADEVEYRFRRWLQKQVRAGHDPRVAAGALAQAIERAQHGTFWYSRELLDRLGDLEVPGLEEVPPETDEQRARRRAQVEATFGPRAAAREHAGAELEQVERDELEDRGRLSDEEVREINADGEGGEPCG